MIACAAAPDRYAAAGWPATSTPSAACGIAWIESGGALATMAVEPMP